MTRFTPTEDQELAIRRMLSEPTRAALNVSDTGGGKTLQAAELALRLGAKSVLVVAPIGTHKGWKATFERQGWKHPVYSIDPNHPENHMLIVQGEPGLYLVGREFFYLSANPSKPDKDGTIKRKARWTWTKTGADLVIVDECFVAGTRVETPKGAVAIEDLSEGDIVYGYDHKNGTVVLSSVITCMVQSSYRLVNGVTPNHPYYVDDVGYVPYGDVTGEDFGYYLNSNLRVLRKRILSVSEKSEPTILQQNLLSAEPGVPRKGKGESCGIPAVGRGETSFERTTREVVGNPRISGVSNTSNDGSEPGVQPNHHGTGDSHSEVPGVYLRILEWWKRSWADQSRSNPIGCLGGWVGELLRCSYPKRAGVGLSQSLQVGSGPARTIAVYRMRRAHSPWAKSEGTRQTKIRFSFGEGLDPLAIRKPRNPERFERVCRESESGAPTTVYNLETSTGNFFAGGFLVHNCHSAKNRYGLMYETLKTLPKTSYRLAMSATPQGSHFDGIWAPTRWLWPQYPGPVDRSKQRWIAQWCETEKVWIGNGEYATKIVGERNPGEFLKSLPCVVKVTVDKKPYQLFDVKLTLSPDHKAVWDEMAETSIAWLNDNPTVAKMPMERRLRLRQMALAMPTVAEDGAVTFAEDAESPKLRAALKVQQRHPGEPILYVTESAKFARIAAPRLGAKLLVGGMKKVDRDWLVDHLGSEYQYLVATYGAIAEGTDGIQKHCSIEVLFQPADGSVPNEQFSGRLNRMGQTAKQITRYRLIAKDTLDDEHYVLSVLNQKLRRAEVDLGGW